MASNPVRHPSPDAANAASANLNYSCDFAGAKLVISLDTNAPATLTTGTSTPVLNGTATVSVAADLADLMRDVVQARYIEGTATVTTLLNGAPQAST